MIEKREVRVGEEEGTLKACMSEMREELCIFARTCAASSVVPRRARTFSCSHNMSSVIGVCSWGGCEGVYVQGHHAEHLKTSLTLSGEREEREKLTVAGNLTQGPQLELPAL